MAANTALKNSELSIEILGHGAELSSILCKGKEYLWQADPKFWKRHSPVLFPIVGSVWNGQYRANGKTFAMSQHGFARDMDFTLLRKTEDEVWYQLLSNDATHQKYPYDFELRIGYRLEGRKIHVMWQVENPTEEEIYFQIGAHPAFYYQGSEQRGVKGYFSFDKKADLTTIYISEKGCADTENNYPIALDKEGLLEINADTFKRDALILQHHQVEEVTLHTPDKQPYLRITFQTPVVGLWAPSPQSPFVCIEPWYGRCDRANFQDEFKEKDWVQTLSSRATFEGGYTIEIL